MIILVFWFFSRHEYLISQILTFLYSMHFFQYTCKVKLLQRTSFHGYRLMIKSSNYKTLLIFPGSRIFSLFPEFQVIFDFLEFQKKAVCHPCIYIYIYGCSPTAPFPHARLFLLHFPVYFCFSYPTLKLLFPDYGVSFPRLWVFLLHFPDYSTSRPRL